MNQPAPYRIKYEVYPEDGMFVARCLDIDVTSDGASDAEAVANLREAIQLYFERNAEAMVAQVAEEDGEQEDIDG
ncbi:hypothetical protein KI614_11690 [Dechloromonas denitrificans]|uniref:type II toxin-antitoxin system HicB family antitoxin n=1 Tax=Dechloromonas denitrificans TaxID=281362 RepID=UPI001CF83800|nr:hypothetical protein [Dechloromonas denitrificans]UCV10837.1 hypothetical protein KI614_11690 [Dechloromonas denitrificans]